ncbi:hypothetical protein LTS17_005739 [Exophiala oligosperma]
MEGPYVEYSGRNYYDIAAIDPDPFPPNYYIGYLNQPHVQVALGLPLNYTNPGGNAPYYAFQDTGDYPRGGYLKDLSYLIDNGIKVALVYGDRDYACNWIGGEAVSLAVNYSHASDFAAAGYANISVNSSYVGGMVRQFGNFSFSRVFQAGHEVPAYKPETAYEIFRRALFNLDIATGQEDTAKNDSFATIGLPDTWSIKDTPHETKEHICYTLASSSSCTDEQLQSIIDGSALISKYILVDNYTLGLATAGNESGNGSGSGNGNGGNESGNDDNDSSATIVAMSSGMWFLIAVTVMATTGV